MLENYVHHNLDVHSQNFLYIIVQITQYSIYPKLEVQYLHGYYHGHKLEVQYLAWLLSWT